ncbi:MAG: radical SAM protein [Candidatus Bathyarchaeia archaeon]
MNAADLFVINPSINVSPYCYSILKVEPYLTCKHECIYCFGRWYRTISPCENDITPNVIQGFKRILSSLKKRNLKTIPYRLSTLVDPFQPKEENHHVSKRIMDICLKNETPLIINTKATLLLDKDYFNILKKLSDKSIVVVQVSLSTINNRIAGILEPGAPSPEKRLDMAEKLSGENIPVIVRLQPFIPGITDCEVEEILRQSRYSGARQVIVEALRDEVANLKIYENLAYDKELYEDCSAWVSYSPSVEVPSKIARPHIKWRFKVYEAVRNLCDKHGLEFSTCKEGLYNYHTAENCCGLHLLDGSKYMLRPTLNEVWSYYKRNNKIPYFEELVKNLPDIYIFKDRLKSYPRALRKKIIAHEKILTDVLNRRRDELNTLLPNTLALNSNEKQRIEGNNP